MLGTIVNCLLILCGSLLGVFCCRAIPERFLKRIGQGLALCVLGIGISSAIKTQNTLCVIVCMVVGCLIGEGLRIEERLEALGACLNRKLPQGDTKASGFVEGFVSASVLYCVGAMAVMGAIDAGIHQDYSILISKGVIDGVTAISFASVWGIGVLFSALPVFLYQGGLTLLASLIATHLSPEALVEMSAVGGLLILGIGFNLLGLSAVKVKVGNMLPAIFLPFLYLPLVDYLKAFF